ncbi:GerMN domain-containing protein [Bacillaceae bacterium S4-13-56]
MQKKIWIGFASLVLSLLLLTGCGFEGEEGLENMDPPQGNVNNGAEDTENNNNNTGDNDGDVEGESLNDVMRTLYLIDSNGLVVPQSLPLPLDESKAVAKQSLEYLVKGGPVTALLPNGFEAVLPAGTEINGVNLKEDGTLVVDFSNEFGEYRAEDELAILQAVTHTLTQFDTVKQVKLQINGYDLEAMPVNNTPISKGLSKTSGINIHSEDVTNLVGSEAVTVYYPAQNGASMYYVPVTTHVEEKENIYASIVEKLIAGPGLNLPLLNVFNDGVKLVEEPSYNDGIVGLTFNESILNLYDEPSIAEEVVETLVLSLTEQPGVEGVQIEVENMESTEFADGVDLSKPVTRPVMINTGSY